MAKEGRRYREGGVQAVSERDIINRMIEGDAHCQRALALMCSSAYVWHFAEIEPGIFALYNYKREAVLVTDDWNEVLQHYRQRPAYVSPQPARKPAPTGLVFKI